MSSDNFLIGNSERSNRSCFTAGCVSPFVDHGQVYTTEKGCKAITECSIGYSHVSGDLIRLCNVSSGTWGGVTPLCQLLPGLSSTHIMLMIAVPILLFFAVCFPIDFYFFRRRKQAKREQQGMVYHREMRRVGMTRAGFGLSLDNLVSEVPRSTIMGSVRKKMTRFKSLISVFNVKRRVSSPLEGQDTDPPIRARGLSLPEIPEAERKPVGMEESGNRPPLIKDGCARRKATSRENDTGLCEVSGAYFREKFQTPNRQSAKRGLSMAQDTRKGEVPNLTLTPDHPESMRPTLNSNGTLEMEISNSSAENLEGTDDTMNENVCEGLPAKDTCPTKASTSQFGANSRNNEKLLGHVTVQVTPFEQVLDKAAIIKPLSSPVISPQLELNKLPLYTISHSFLDGPEIQRLAKSPPFSCSLNL